MTAPKENKQDRYLSVRRVAEILGCSERYVYEMVREGKLKALRLGIRAIRISEKSLNAFVELNIVDPEDYYGFEEAKDPNPDPVHSIKVVRPAWMEK